eukprot:scaffold25895_cov108-Cylindrotheca_fusiformis.AAC.3
MQRSSLENGHSGNRKLSAKRIKFICNCQHHTNNMTIKVEREALLRVLTRDPSGPSLPCEKTIPSNEEYVVVDIPKPFMGEDFYDKCLRDPTADDESTCTLSTSSLSTESTQSIERRVTFSETLVSDEWTRPFTPREEVSNLFYSTEETLRFRQEYRLERKVLNELSIDIDNHNLDSEELSSLIATTSDSRSSRHGISRVVVMHNDKLETFINPTEAPSFLTEDPCSGGVDFFDNDSFWSGSLTWY